MKMVDVKELPKQVGKIVVMTNLRGRVVGKILGVDPKVGELQVEIRDRELHGEVRTIRYAVKQADKVRIYDESEEVSALLE